MKKMFPEYLNVGSKGPAVVVLQLILLAMGCNDEIVADGDYGEQTANGVRDFQAEREQELDQDGNFGPKTRTTFFNFTGIDVDTLDADLFVGETVCAELAPVPVAGEAKAT